MAILKIKTQVKDAFRESTGNHKYHDEDAITDVIDYVLRGDKAPYEYVGGWAVDPWLAKEQFRIVAQAYGKDFGVRLRHMILSFGPKENIDLHSARDIAYQIAAYYGHSYQIIWACHTDSNCLNVHLVMNTVSYQNGIKYDGSKADYYRFQNHVNGVLKQYGTYVSVVKDES